MNSTYNDMLQALLSATRDGRLVWAKPCPQEYTAAGPIVVTIREIAPLVSGATETIGTQAFEVNVNGWINTLWAGTTGGDLVFEILATGFAEWAHHRDAAAGHVNEIITRLRQK